MKKRAMSSEEASRVKRGGHEAEKRFAEMIGGEVAKRQEKKDVIDSRGDYHSVKSGRLKWQIFLYRRETLSRDRVFAVINGVGETMAACVDCFPESREEYLRDKAPHKRKLADKMRLLREKLARPKNLHAFFLQSFFRGGQVQYLSVESNTDGELSYRVFAADDAVDLLAEELSVENSVARREGEFSAQKVVFKWRGKTIGEIEMRNDSAQHYREVKFWMSIPLTVELLAAIEPMKQVLTNLTAHSEAARRFKIEKN